jgi:Tfp pilus assembly protein PilF
VSVIGPFPKENGGGDDQAFGPERDGAFEATHAGWQQEVGWQAVQDLGRTGAIRLDQAVPQEGRIVAYVWVDLQVPAAAEATLHLGTPGGTKAWLGGQPILADPDDHPARFDQTSLPVSLRRGSNHLLLKVTDGGVGPFQLELRVVDRKGAPIRGLAAVAPRGGSYPLPRTTRRPLRGASPLVEELEAQARRSPRGLEDLARVLGERHPFPWEARRHVRVAGQAAEAAPERVEAQLLAARFQTEDPDERRRWLERAVAAERDGEALAHAAWAEHWLSRGLPWKALEALEARLPQARGDWQAHWVWSRAWQMVGRDALARRILEALVEEHPHEPSLHRALGQAARRDGQVMEAIRRWRVALALAPADRTCATLLAGALLEVGEPAQADDVLASVGRLLPLDVSLLAWRGEILAANGRPADGRRWLEAALEIGGGQARRWERLGALELAAGQRAAAAEAFERALALRPQDATLREQLAALRGARDEAPALSLADLRQVVEQALGSHPGEDAVRLVDQQEVRVLPSGQAARTVQRIVQVRNQRGVERFQSFPIRYFPGRETLRIERARILREDGTLESGHLERERSLSDPAAGIVYDARLRTIVFPSLRQGDTVELVYRLDDVAPENLLSDSFGDLVLAQDTVPTARWEYALRMPPGREIHVAAPEGATYEVEEGPQGAVHRWSLEDVPKLIPEPGMPGWVEIAKHLHVSTFASWDEVARYWSELIRDPIQPTPRIEGEARRLVAGIPERDTLGRVRAIHDFVVSKTRYVGLELGIHSYKPYPVEQVLRRGFGDCKDKASLTHALLRSVGIHSELVLLRMRHLGRIPSTPASMAVFNHAILYVPSLDLYLDGTAEWSGSGELPEADRGAEILIVHPDGTGTRGRTEEAPLGLSSTTTRLRVRLDTDGAGTVEGETVVRGLGAPHQRRRFASTNRRLATLEASWAKTYPGVQAVDMEIGDPRRIEEDVRYTFELPAPSLARGTGSGGLAIYPLGRQPSFTSTYAPLSSRRYDLVLDHPWSEEVVVELELPAGFRVAELPSAEALRSPFGNLELTYEVVDDRLVVRRVLEFDTARIAPEDYPHFRAHLSKIDAALGKQVILEAGSI